MPTAFRTSGSPAETLTSQAVALMRPAARFFRSPAELVPGGSTVIQQVSGHGVAVLAGGAGQISNLAGAFVLPAAFYGVDLEIVAYVTKEGFTAETVHLDAGLVDSGGSGGGGFTLSANVNVTAQSPNEVVFPGTDLVNGDGTGQMVELLFRRDASNVGDENVESVNLYMLEIRPA